MSDICHFAKIQPRTKKWYALCGAHRKGDWQGAWKRELVECPACIRKLDALLAKGRTPHSGSLDEGR
jgi:hypothetical protein